MSDAAITRDLPALKWRGLLAPPYDLIPFDWVNRLPERKYYGVDGDAHDPTGRDSIRTSVRLYFVNTVVQEFAGLGRLFPDYWETWRDQLMDGEAGDLEHPVLGPIRARVPKVGGVLETKCQSGIIVDISWVETNEDPSTFTALGNIPADPAKLAGDADTNAGAFGVVVAPGRLPVMFTTQYGLQFPDGFVQPTLASIYDAIRTSVFVADLTALSTLSALMGDVAMMIDSIGALDNAAAWPAIVACRSFWMALRTQRANLAAAARVTKTDVVGRRMTLDAFARAHGNSLAEVMALNAAALSGPFVDRGTALSYYVNP